MVISKSADETKKLAASLLQQLDSINLICLYGPLGSGKTTFVQGLAQSLGIKKPIISPTFILLRSYKISQFSIFIHVDCYRIKSEKDFKSIDLKELWSEQKNLVVIEWADRVKNILPKKRIDIKFEYLGKNKRKISIINH